MQKKNVKPDCPGAETRERFSFFQLKNNQKHTAKKAQDGLQENLVNVQVCHSQNSSLTPIQHLGKKKK